MPDPQDAIENAAIEVSLQNAAVFLIEAATAAGKPIVLATRGDMTPGQGISGGDPNAIDLEPILGLVLALPCDRHQAQFLLNGLQALLEDLEDHKG